MKDKDNYDNLTDIFSTLVDSLDESGDGGVEMVGLSPRFRVQIWPCLSSDAPKAAMGLFTILGYLAEQWWTNAAVTNSFIKAIENPEDYVWSINDSQFDMEGELRVNRKSAKKISGRLNQATSAWTLGITVVDEVADEGEDHSTFNYEAGQLGDLVLLLPQVLNDIAAALKFNIIAEPAFAFGNPTDDVTVTGLLKRLFAWERGVLLTQKGIEQSEEQIISDFDALITSCSLVGGEFGAWCIAYAVSQALEFYAYFIEVIVFDIMPKVLATFPNSETPAILFGRVLYTLSVKNRNHAIFQEVCRLFEKETKRHPHRMAAWQVLAEIYRAVGRIKDSIHIYQHIIESGLATEQIYLDYVETLLDASYKETKIKNFIFLTHRHAKPKALWEAVEAYQAVLDKTPDNKNVLLLQLKLCAQYNLIDNRVWKNFEHLVEIDDTGHVVHDLVDEFYNLDDCSPGASILRRAISRQPERYDLHHNLGVLLLNAGNRKDAQVSLAKAAKLTDDRHALKDISRTTLLALKPPEFEMHLCELEAYWKVHLNFQYEHITCAVTKVHGTLKEQDVQFLEDIVALVPTYIAMYILLACYYWKFNEPENAIEVLLDAHQQDSDHPDTILYLAALLWESGERKRALNYLENGLRENPDDIALLALAGRCYFADGQEERGKTLVRKAKQLISIGTNLWVLQAKLYIESKQAAKS